MFTLHTGDDYLGYETTEWVSLDEAMLALQRHCNRVVGYGWVSAIVYTTENNKLAIHYQAMVKEEEGRLLVR